MRRPISICGPLGRWLEDYLQIATQSVLVIVAFATRGFEIEHQILHVHAKLAECFLNQVQDAATTLGVFHHTIKWLSEIVTMLLWQALDC